MLKITKTLDELRTLTSDASEVSALARGVWLRCLLAPDPHHSRTTFMTCSLCHTFVMRRHPLHRAPQRVRGLLACLIVSLLRHPPTCKPQQLQAVKQIRKNKTGDFPNKK